jgi:hypothetical protein
MASLFLPQMNSTAEKPHPMVLKFLEEALIFRQLKEGVALKRRSNKNTTGVKKL